MGEDFGGFLEGGDFGGVIGAAVFTGPEGEGAEDVQMPAQPPQPGTGGRTKA